MVFSLQIRTQLILIILLVSSGFFVQLSIANVSQQNTDYVLQNETDYLQRDNSINEQISELNTQVSDLISTRIEDYFYAILKQQRNSGITAGSNLLDLLNSTIDLIYEREDIQYKLDRSEIFEIPNVASMDDDLINQLNDIIDTSENGMSSILVKEKSTISNLFEDLETDVNKLNYNYVSSSSTLETSSDELLEQLHLFDTSILELSHKIQATSNDSYIADTLPYISSLQNITMDISQSLIDFFKAINFEKLLYDEALGTSVMNSLISTISVNINKTNSQLENLNNSLLSTEFNHFDAIISNQTLLNSKFQQFETSANNFQNAFLKISNYDNSEYITKIEELKVQIGNVLFIFNQETETFQDIYASILVEVRSISNQLFLTLSGVLVIFVLIIMIPMILRLRGLITRLQRNFDKLEQGKLNIKRPKRIPNNEFGEVENSFHDMIENFNGIVKQIQSSSDYLADVSEELAAGTEESNATISEISKNLDTISSGTLQQQNMIDNIKSELIELEKLVNQTTIEINNASHFVGKISTRTNVLGLNAAISAAKAGKFATGFGIVAEEIRDLARSSKGSAEEISQLIDEINFSIRKSVQDIQNSVKRISELSNRTTEGVEISNSSATDQVIMISEISDTSNNLADLANTLNHIVQQFDVE